MHDNICTVLDKGIFFITKVYFFYRRILILKEIILHLIVIIIIIIRKNAACGWCRHPFRGAQNTQVVSHMAWQLV